MTQNKDQMRAEFEQWARSFGTWEVRRDDEPNFEIESYTDTDAAVAWHTWQAARASAQTQIDWHQQRWAALQQHLQLLREPERTLVCDGLANGQLLCGPDGAIDAARYVSAPQGVPAFSSVAQRKLQELQGKGYAITGYAIERPTTEGGVDRGFVNNAGFVGWWQPAPHSLSDEEKLNF